MRRNIPIAAAAVAVSGAAALVIGLLAGSGPAAPAAHAAVTAASHGVDHWNEAAPHSPLVEQMLAGAVAQPKTVRSSAASPAATAQAPSVKGIDLSSFQHPGGAAVNWTNVEKANYKFAFVKVSEGSYYVNPYYASDVRGAQSVGMVVAPYIFAIPNYSGGALQADYGLDAAGYTPNGKTLTPILDIEYDPYAGSNGDGTSGYCYGLTVAQMVSWIKAFAAETHRRTGHVPVIYTTAQWWDKCTGGSKAFSADPLWIAGNDSADTAPIMPAAWTNWTYWQFTSVATLTGISGQFDVSYVNPGALELALPANQSGGTSRPASLTVSALDGSTTPATFEAAGLPPGLSINSSSGLISGTLPAGTGKFQTSVEAIAGTATATQAFSWDVHGAISFGSLPARSGSAGAPVRFQLPASDGLGGCTLRFSASGLPSGLSITACGLIHGWLQADRRYTVTVRATDSSGAAAQRSFSWTVNPPAKGGPSGQLRQVRDGKCLTALSSTDIAIENCAAKGTKTAKKQHWTVAANGAIRLGSVCLNARTAKGSARASLDLVSCPRGGQRWQIGTNAVLVNLTDGRCLTDTGTKNGSKAYAERCFVTFNKTGSASTPGRNQVWTAPAGPLVSGIPGHCASDWHSAGVKFGGVTLRGCGAATASPWTVEPDGAIGAGGRCLGLNGGKTTVGTAVRLIGCRRSAEQVWQISGGPTGIELLNPASGLCLADPGDRARAGTALAIEPCMASDPGVWWRVS